MTAQLGGLRRELDRNEPSVLDREDASKIGGAGRTAQSTMAAKLLDVGLGPADGRAALPVAVCRKRVGQIAVARVQFREQAHVLDGDHRLIGEGAEESNVPVRKALGLLPSDAVAPMASPSRRMAPRSCSHHGAMGWLPANCTAACRSGTWTTSIEEATPSGAVRSGGRGTDSRCGRGLRPEVVMGGQAHERAVVSHHDTADGPSHSSTAWRAMALNTGCTSVGAELEITRRYLRSPSAAPGLGQVSVRASSSLNSRTFSIAMTAWSAKVWSSAICLALKGRTSVR